MFYYRGDIGLVESRSVSVVGARKASEEGLKRAKKVARELSDAGFTIVSGLAEGVDTAASGLEKSDFALGPNRGLFLSNYTSVPILASSLV